MKILIFTTSTSQFFKTELSYIDYILSTSKGRGKNEFTIESIRATNPQLITDIEGHTRINWDWFNETFGNDGYDVVAYHFTDYWKKKWGITRSINGSFNKNNTKQFHFWLCANRDEQAKYYPFLEFTRIFLHEMGHGDAIRLGKKDVVHYYDYQLNSIHTLFYKYDYRIYNLKKKLADVLKKLWLLKS